jgi:ribonucleoside-diphosphate reductase alpha chain
MHAHAQWTNGATAVAQELVTDGAAGAMVIEAAMAEGVEGRMERIREARLKGYEGDACGECGNFTLVRNGTCLKCATCGSTSGCS